MGYKSIYIYQVDEEFAQLELRAEFVAGFKRE